MMLDLPPPPPALEDVILHRESDGEAVLMLLTLKDAADGIDSGEEVRAYEPQAVRED